MTNSSSSALISNSAGLRSRKVDLKKPLAIIRFDTVKDPDELAAMSRLQSNVTTGVEKGEEEEHHLQAALVSRHAVSIPTPDASTLADLPNYEKYYTADFELSKTFIKHSAQAEQDMGCPYNLNTDDLVWLESLDVEMRSIITDDDFEFAIYFLDECGNDKVSGECPEWDEIVKVLETKENMEFKPSMDHDALALVYDYWCKARYQRNGGKLLRPILKSEEMSAQPDNDPYVCFRIREIKIHRKVRRSDTLAQDKLRRLKNDMMIVCQLLDLVAQRERARKEVLEVNRLVFEKRMQVRRLKRILGVNTADNLDASPEKTHRKKHRLDGERTSIRIPLQNLREAASIVTDMDAYLADDGKDHATDHRIEEKIKRERAIQEKSGWLDCTEFPFRPLPSTSLWGPHLGIESRDGVHISTRRRMGRGGRIIFDRHVQFNRPSIDSRLQDPEEPSIAIHPQISSVMYRGFALNQPSKGDGTQLLHNKPSKINNFDPTKVPPIPPPPTDIIRAPPPKKKTPKVSGERSIDGTSAASTSQQHSPATMSRNKKKLDNDVAAKSTEKVKQFLKVAQQQAAMQMQKNGGVSSGTAGISNANNHNNTVSNQGTPDMSGGMAIQNQMNGMNPNQIMQQQRLQQMLLMNQQGHTQGQQQQQQQQPFMISQQLVQQQLSLMPAHIQQQFASLTSQQQALFLRQLVLGMGMGQQNQAMGMQMQQPMHQMQMQFQMQQQQALLQQQFLQQQMLQQQMQAANGPFILNMGGNISTNNGNSAFQAQLNQQPQMMNSINQHSANNLFNNNQGNGGVNTNQQPQQQSSIQISSDGKIRMSKQEKGAAPSSVDTGDGGGNPDVSLLSPNAEVSV